MGAEAPSSKRILWAFLLCFTVGAHRIYAGKIISGIVQMALLLGGFIWSYATLKGLIAMYNSAPLDLDMIQRMADWQQAHGDAARLPSLILLATGIWVAVDAGRLLAGKFTDAQGKKITRWV